MERLYQHGPGFRYHVFWRQSSSTYWNSAYENNPAADSYEIDVDDIYGLYDIRVKAENDLGESHQPAFVFKGRSGEAGTVLPVFVWGFGGGGGYVCVGVKVCLFRKINI